MSAPALLAALAATALLSAGCRGWTSEAPPVHLNPNMDTQHKYRAYRASEFFENGRAMRMPVPDTVPRSLDGDGERDGAFLHLDDHFYEGMVDGKPALGFPPTLKVTEAVIKRGEGRYNIYCAPCHAKDGGGNGTVAQRLPVEPPSFHQARIYNLPLGDIYNTIKHGKNWPNMPSYAHQIVPRDRWAVVAYVRALMKTQNPSVGLVPSADQVAPDPSELAGDPLKQGEAIYNKTCIACHTLDGTKVVGPTFKGIWGRKGVDTEGNEYTVDADFVKESILSPNKRVAEGYQPVMPPQQLSDEELSSVVEWMKSL